MRIFLIFFSISILNLSIEAKDNNRFFTAVKTQESIKIDGHLNEEVWNKKPDFHSFYQYVPNNGASPSSKTEAWFYYSDQGVYIGIKCYEENADSIYKELRVRDDGFGSNSDGIGIMLSP